MERNAWDRIEKKPAKKIFHKKFSPTNYQLVRLRAFIGSEKIQNAIAQEEAVNYESKFDQVCPFACFLYKCKGVTNFKERAHQK